MVAAAHLTDRGKRVHRQLVQAQQGRTTVLVFIDEQLLQCCPQLPQQIDAYFSAHATDLHLQAAPIPVPAGELSKTPDVLQQLYAHMLEHGLDRHCYVLALGGGAVLDAVGYACATFHRGMRLIRIPTTVLAQNDAGIGVKNGINAFAQSDSSKKSGTPSNNSALSTLGSNTAKPFNAASPNTTFAPNMISPNQGGGFPHENQQPYLGVNFCIALQGVFPAFP